MGIIADFFVATPEEAMRYPLSDELEDDDWDEGDDEPEPWVDPRESLERLQLKSITGLDMGLLWADLVDVPWDVHKHMLDTVAHDGEWGIDVFPAEFVELLVSVPAARTDPALARWGEREEMARWDKDDIRQFFGQLQALARSAKAQGKGVYLYNVA